MAFRNLPLFGGADGGEGGVGEEIADGAEVVQGGGDGDGDGALDGFAAGVAAVDGGGAAFPGITEVRGEFHPGVIDAEIHAGVGGADAVDCRGEPGGVRVFFVPLADQGVVAVRHGVQEVRGLPHAPHFHRPARGEGYPPAAVAAGVPVRLPFQLERQVFRPARARLPRGLRQPVVRFRQEFAVGDELPEQAPVIQRGADGHAFGDGHVFSVFQLGGDAVGAPATDLGGAVGQAEPEAARAHVHAFRLGIHPVEGAGGVRQGMGAVRERIDRQGGMAARVRDQPDALAGGEGDAQVELGREGHRAAVFHLEGNHPVWLFRFHPRMLPAHGIGDGQRTEIGHGDADHESDGDDQTDYQLRRGPSPRPVPEGDEEGRRQHQSGDEREEGENHRQDIPR